MDAVQFISFLDLSPLYVFLRQFYREPYKIKHSPEAMLRLVALQKLKRYKFLSELDRELDDRAVKLLGFKYKPSYKTLWHWLNKRVGPQGLETIHTKLMELINQSLSAQGIRMAQEVSGDATHIQADPKDKEAAYNGHLYALGGTNNLLNPQAPTNAVNEQYFPLGYGEPAPSPSQNPTISPSTPQTMLYYVIAAVVLIIILTTIVVTLFLRRRHSSVPSRSTEALQGRAESVLPTCSNT